jgi:hypothetical protein
MSDVIVVAIVAAVPGVLTAALSLLNHRSISLLQVQVDGRLTELLELTAKAARAEGRIEDGKSPPT